MKDIQDILEQWARGTSTSREVNELYIQLGMDLNTAISAFQYHRMDIRLLLFSPKIINLF
jgi:hypothetical protein